MEVRQASKQVSRQASRQASRPASRPAGQQPATKQAGRQAGKQADKQAGKHLGGHSVGAIPCRGLFLNVGYKCAVHMYLLYRKSFSCMSLNRVLSAPDQSPKAKGTGRQTVIESP